MKFSLAVAVQRYRDKVRYLDVAALVRECRAAEELGFYAVYSGERRASGVTSYSHNPLIVSSWILSVTTSLRVGAGLVVLPLHHPVTVIQDASVLAELSGGRFILGLGAGYTGADFEALGVSMNERGRRMEAGLKAIAAYRQGVIQECDSPYAGTVPKRDEALGEVELRVLAGGWSLPGVRRAARHTDGWISGPLDTYHALAEMATAYRDECRRLNRSPYVAVLREAWLADTDDEAISVYGPYVLSYHMTYLKRGKVYDPRFDPWVNRIRSADELTLDDVLPNRVLIGSRDTWMRELHRLCELVEPDEIVLRLRHVDGPSPGMTLEVMEAIASSIMPSFA